MKRVLALLLTVLMVAGVSAFIFGCNDETADIVTSLPPFIPNFEGARVEMFNFAWIGGFELRADDWNTWTTNAPGSDGRFNLQMPIWFDGEHSHQFTEFENYDWYLWIREFCDDTMIEGTNVGGGWRLIPVHIDSTFSFSENRGFRVMPSVLQDANGNRTWNRDMIELRRGVEYEYIISIMRDGEYMVTSYSMWMQGADTNVEAIALYYELYQVSGLGRNVSDEGYSVMDERLIFFFANFERFVTAYGNFRNVRPPSDWDPTGMPGWVGWDAVVAAGFEPGANPVDSSAPWYTAPPTV